MKKTTCLVTGGAGFIGCALSEHLVRLYDCVIAVDCLHPQVHARPERPEALHADVELKVGDICDPAVWDALLPSLSALDVVIHLAAETGTGQSLTKSTRHGHTNVVGTTQLMDALARHGRLPTQIVLTSSRAVYGEGAWRRTDGSVFYPGQRSHAMLAAKQWNFPGAMAMPSSARHTTPHPASVYAATKLCQEHLLRVWGLAMGVSIKTLRMQNVYGPGQSTTNPYTGILPLFARVARSGGSIEVYEDGRIVRDFVHIDDVTVALLLALSYPTTGADTWDIGSGQATTIAQAAEWIAACYGAPAPHISEQFRDGDVRHAVCDPSDAHKALGFTPKIPAREGIVALCTFLENCLR